MCNVGKNMQTTLITGSSSGIGRAIAEHLLKKNHKIIGLARDHSKFNPSSSDYFSYSIDFAKIQQLETKCREIHKEQPQINNIICCAGYGEFAELEQFSVAQMQNMLNVNFLSQAILIKTFLPSLKKISSAKIIMLGSECALDGQKKGSIYCASKFALRGFAQSLRKECSSSQVAVTLINPGMVDTPFFDDLTFRPGSDPSHSIQASQIAQTVMLLLDQRDNFVFEEINLQPMKKVIEKKSKLINE